MKNKIISLAIVAVVAAAGWGFHQNKKSVVLSDIILDNVEALAMNESGGNGTDQACIACISPEGYKGIRLYCKYGSGGCVETVCVAGTCIGFD